MLTEQEINKIKELLETNDFNNQLLAIELYKGIVGNNFFKFYVDEIIQFDDERLNKIRENDDSYIIYDYIFNNKLLDYHINLEYKLNEEFDEKYYIIIYDNNLDYDKFFNTREELIEHLSKIIKI